MLVFLFLHTGYFKWEQLNGTPIEPYLQQPSGIVFHAQNVNEGKSFWFMCDSCHIRNVLIGVKYRNCHQTLDVYLPFATWMGQIQNKTSFHICKL